MVARDSVLHQLRLVLTGPAPPVAAVLRGDGGMGKTTLLQAAAQVAVQTGGFECDATPLRRSRRTFRTPDR